MTSPLLYLAATALGGVLGAGGSLLKDLVQRRSDGTSQMLARSFESRLPQYEALYVAARRAKASLEDLLEGLTWTEGGRDEFLETMLRIARRECGRLSNMSDWRSNPSIIHLPQDLEERCAAVGKEVRAWLSVSRLRTGHQYEQKLPRTPTAVPGAPEIYALVTGHVIQEFERAVPQHEPGIGPRLYRELRVRQVPLANMDTRDQQNTKRLITGLADLLRELRRVIAY